MTCVIKPFTFVTITYKVIRFDFLVRDFLFNNHIFLSSRGIILKIGGGSMFLKRMKIGTSYQCDSRTKDLINFYTTVQLNDKEKDIFTKSTILLANHPDFKSLRKRPVSIIFSGESNIKLAFPDEVIGTQGSYIFIDYQKWTRLQSGKKLICLLEEFVHHFWDTTDEIKTSEIVCQFIDGLDYDRKTGAYINI